MSDPYAGDMLTTSLERKYVDGRTLSILLNSDHEYRVVKSYAFTKTDGFKKLKILTNGRSTFHDSLFTNTEIRAKVKVDIVNGETGQVFWTSPEHWSGTFWDDSWCEFVDDNTDVTGLPNNVIHTIRVWFGAYSNRYDPNISIACHTMRFEVYKYNHSPVAVIVSPTTYVNTANPTLVWEYRDRDGNAGVSYQVDVSQDSAFETGVTTYTPSLIRGTGTGTTEQITVSSPLSDGLWHWRVKVKDSIGDWSTYASTSLVVDTDAPTGTVSINDGAAQVAKASVTVSLSVSDGSGLSEMRFSNDGATYTAWEPYGATKQWTLTNGAGVKTVYVQVKDVAGNVATFQDTIERVTSPGTMVVNNGAIATNSPQVTLSLWCIDPGATMAFAEGTLVGGEWQPGSWSAYEPYAASREWNIDPSSVGDGEKCVFVNFRMTDNTEHMVYDTITLDTIAPAKVTGLTVWADQNLSTRVMRLSWDPVTTDSSQENPQPEPNLPIPEYRVYRSTVELGTYTQVGSTSDTTWTDNSPLSDNQPYYYKVCAVDAAGNFGATSNVDFAAYCKFTPSEGKRVLRMHGSPGVNRRLESDFISLAAGTIVSVFVSYNMMHDLKGSGGLRIVLEEHTNTLLNRTTDVLPLALQATDGWATARLERIELADGTTRIRLVFILGDAYGQVAFDQASIQVGDVLTGWDLHPSELIAADSNIQITDSGLLVENGKFELRDAANQKLLDGTGHLTVPSISCSGNASFTTLSCSGSASFSTLSCSGDAAFQSLTSTGTANVNIIRFGDSPYTIVAGPSGLDIRWNNLPIVRISSDGLDTFFTVDGEIEEGDIPI